MDDPLFMAGEDIHGCGQFDRFESSEAIVATTDSVRVTGIH
ncbi:hypothetical protein [Sulfobacillus thermosulfidooxidans]|nr:hypothetical protein [Sulfobacillus thermosulfidooxidans]